MSTGLTHDAVGFDVSALSASTTPDDLIAFRQRHSGDVGWGRAPVSGPVVNAVMWSLVFAAIGLFFIGLPVMTLIEGGLAPIGTAILLIASPALGYPLARLVVKRFRYEVPPTDWPRRLRLARFAVANGFAYRPRWQGPPRWASPLASGKERIVLDFFAHASLEVGNYRTDDKHNRGAAPDGWGWIRIGLDRDLPHLLLAPVDGRRPIRSVVAVSGDQVLALEGDFGRHFRLFVPSGYERDALYVITPDLMVALIDRVPGSFVETVDRHLVIAFPRPFDFADPDEWFAIEQIVTHVGGKAHRQTHRYRDGRSAIRGGVAMPGRRLRRGISMTAILTASFGALYLLIMLLPLLGRLL